MKKQLFALAVILVFFTRGQASEKFITGGLNISQFYDAISKPLPGYSIGFGWEWKLSSSLALLFSPSYLYRGAKLEKKTVWSELSNRLFEEDIWCRIGYLELPLNCRYYYNSLYLSAGISANLAVHDGSNSKTISERTVYGYPGKHDYSVDIDAVPGYILGSSSIDCILGGGIRKGILAIGGAARISFGKRKSLHRIQIGNSDFISLSVLGFWYF